MDYRVIKDEDLFCLSEKNGDIYDNNNGYGLYTKDTRFLSRMELRLNNQRPTLLSAETGKSYQATFHLMIDKKDEGAFEIIRNRFIYGGVLYEKVTVTNFFLEKKSIDLTAEFDADFQDMFIVRKFRSGKVGEKLTSKYENQGKIINYLGADGIERQTKISWDIPESAIKENGEISFLLSLAPNEAKHIVFTIIPAHNNQKVEISSFENALEELEKSYAIWNGQTTKIKSNLNDFDELYNRSVQDLRMLMSDIGYGSIPVAGLPWFAVPFGRDSLITSLFMLPLSPAYAKGTLRTLAKYQGKKVDPWRDEQPGKIMHEIRFGELSTTNQSPFTPYYGTIDATPLFLVLIGEYFNWTNDLSFIKELLPNIKQALDWIDIYGDRNKSGFVSYHQEAEKGFPNQGWKDSSNSIVHQNGELAKSPIALVEVQGYVYHAKTLLAPILRLIAENELAEKLEKDSEVLKALFEASFWIEEQSFYALALDGGKRPVNSITSNPGHLLMSGMLGEKKAEKVAKRLLAEDMFTGFGIRTMSKNAVGYYPMSYHNGSVWPHDNGMILIGLNKYGFKKESKKIVNGMLKASKYFEYQRLPELFCGHDSDNGYPVLYPTTCSPQAWAAGAAIVFVQTILGINPNSITKQIQLNPSLPDGMDYLEVENMSIGNGTISLIIKRTNTALEEYKIEIRKNTTGFEII